MRRVATSNRLMATIETPTAATTAMASTLAAPSSSGKHKTTSSCSSIASSLFGGAGWKQQHHQVTTTVPSNGSNSSRKSAGKEKRWRHKEDERVEKLRLLVSYLRNGSSQQLLVKPVKLEADEIELAQRYKSLPTLCENCLKSMELQQPTMDPMPNSHATGSVSSCSIMNLSGACDSNGAAVGLYHTAGSNYSSCSRTPEIGWNQSSLSGCSSHKQLNTSQSSAGIVINVRRSSEQSECLASASDTDSHHNQQLTSAESDQTGSTYSGSSGSTTNLQANLADLISNGGDGCVHSPGLSSMALPAPLLASSATIDGPSSNGIYHQSSPKMFYIGDNERRDGCSWTNPPNLATWIDNEVNSLVNDLEAKSQLVKNEKSMKSSKRKWLPSASGNRRSSSGAQST